MTKALTISYKTMHHYKGLIFSILAAGILLSAGFYAYFLQETIMNIVAREKISKEISLKSTEVGDLEATYFSLKNTVTLDLAHKKGFRNAEVTSYISKGSLTAFGPNNEL